MMNPRATFTLTVFVCALSLPIKAQQKADSELELISGEGDYSFGTHLARFTNDVVIKYRGAVLTADSVTVNDQTLDTVAEGKVRIQMDDQIWAGEHIKFNPRTRQIVTEQFRTGKAPFFAGGEGLSGEPLHPNATGQDRNATNDVYTATNAYITADDYSKPAIRVQAKHIRIIPGQRIEATHATLYLGDVPVFYFPYYSRNLGVRANNFNVVPGYRSSYGPFILGNYTWFLNDQLDGELHVDYREERGVGAGPDFNVHLGRWGNGTLSYYYTHDNDPSTNNIFSPVAENRQRLNFSYQANPYTNFNVKSAVRYQSDAGVTRDFFESEYRKDPQPNTFVEVNKFWRNFSLDVLTQPRVNEFFETVERLPDVRLSGFRQQLGPLPLFYESESSVGYYRRLFAETNNAPPGMDFEAGRADTYHQITLPQTFFGWLNFTPRAGGRFTYYTEVDGLNGSANTLARTNVDTFRGIFNTGAEVTFKASRLWPGMTNQMLQLDGLRHIVEPSVNYVYIPTPNYRPDRLPQFDYESASLRQLPIEFPEYNNIDTIDSQNVLRFGLRNTLQTKRDGQVDNVLNWEVFTDWRLRPNPEQKTNNQNGTFSDIFSDLTLRPRSGITLQSLTRYDIGDNKWTLALHTLTLEPNNVWNWTLGHFYLRNDTASTPTGLGEGNSLVTSSIFYRVNENWGLRANHHYDLRGGRLQEQFYTVYRDFRSWTAGLTGGLRDNQGSQDDFFITFTFSLKAKPRYGLDSEAVRPYSLLGR